MGNLLTTTHAHGGSRSNRAHVWRASRPDKRDRFFAAHEVPRGDEAADAAVPPLPARVNHRMSCPPLYEAGGGRIVLSTVDAVASMLEYRQLSDPSYMRTRD